MDSVTISYENYMSSLYYNFILIEIRLCPQCHKVYLGSTDTFCINRPIINLFAIYQ